MGYPMYSPELQCCGNCNCWVYDCILAQCSGDCGKGIAKVLQVFRLAQCSGDCGHQGARELIPTWLSGQPSLGLTHINTDADCKTWISSFLINWNHSCHTRFRIVTVDLIWEIFLRLEIILVMVRYWQKLSHMLLFSTFASIRIFVRYKNTFAWYRNSFHVWEIFCEISEWWAGLANHQAVPTRGSHFSKILLLFLFIVRENQFKLIIVSSRRMYSSLLKHYHRHQDDGLELALWLKEVPGIYRANPGLSLPPSQPASSVRHNTVTSSFSLTLNGSNLILQIQPQEKSCHCGCSLDPWRVGYSIPVREVIQKPSLTETICEHFDPCLSFIKWQNNPIYGNLLFLSFNFGWLPPHFF